MKFANLNHAIWTADDFIAVADAARTQETSEATVALAPLKGMSVDDVIGLTEHTYRQEPHNNLLINFARANSKTLSREEFEAHAEATIDQESEAKIFRIGRRAGISLID